MLTRDPRCATVLEQWQNAIRQPNPAILSPPTHETRETSACNAPFGRPDPLGLRD